MIRFLFYSNRKSFLLIVSLLISVVFFGQPKLKGKDSTIIKKTWSQAKKSTLMSVCVPGLGQIQNKKYWKLPIIYGLMGGMGYFIYSNHIQYQDFQNAISYRYDNISGNESYPQFTVDNLVTLSRTYRRYRDYSILGAGLIYLLQIIDANVDAHLMNFDVDNISFRFRPEYFPSQINSNNNYIGLNLCLTLKK